MSTSISTSGVRTRADPGRPSVAASEISICDACACFAAFAIASDTTKYAATSIDSGSRASVVTSSSTGMPERRASVRRAGPRPPWDRIAG